MPRIAAAIGVFATIAVFIFINIKSYPAVWEMVGTSPWFIECEESSPQENSPQPEMVAEKDMRAAAPSMKTPPQPTPSMTTPSKPTPPRPKLKSLADSISLDRDNLSKPTGFGPRLAPERKSATDLQAGSLADGAAKGNGPSSAYRGLNLGPIKVAEANTADNSPSEKMTSGNSTNTTPTPLLSPRGSRWPAEMSPRMKYAAKPPILETYQNWNPRRPLVPVKQPKETKKPVSDKRDKKQDKSPKGSSCSKRPVEQGKPAEQGKEAAKAIVRRLPPIDSKNHPIRMSIPTRGPNSPIPIYPITGR